MHARIKHCSRPLAQCQRASTAQPNDPDITLDRLLPVPCSKEASFGVKRQQPTISDSHIYDDLEFAEQNTHCFALLYEHWPIEMTPTLHFRFSSALSLVLTVGWLLSIVKTVCFSQLQFKTVCAALNVQLNRLCLHLIKLLPGAKRAFIEIIPIEQLLLLDVLV